MEKRVLKIIRLQKVKLRQDVENCVKLICQIGNFYGTDIRHFGEKVK